MWRKLSIILLFFTLVQSAYALPRLGFAEQLHVISTSYNSTNNIHQVKVSAPTALDSDISFDENLSQKLSKSLPKNITTQSIALEEESNDELYIHPRITRASTSSFSSELQTSPYYVLVIEFFAIKLTAGLYKNLANPPLIVDWFEQLSAKSTSSRISGWKDSNLLYTSVVTYQS